MEKIRKLLVPDPCDAFVELGNSHRVYMSGIGSRKPETIKTLALSFRSLFLRSDEQTQKIDELIDEVAELRKLLKERGDK